MTPPPAPSPALQDWRRFLEDSRASACLAGLTTVLVGFATSVSLVLAAARHLGASPAQISTWVLALCLGMGLTGIWLSLRERQPITLAWSTAGAALIITTAEAGSLAEATGAFVLCATLTWLSGCTGLFERLAGRIPPAIAAGLLAGSLLPFGLELVTQVSALPLLAAPVCLSYLLIRRAAPLLAAPGALLVALTLGLTGNGLHPALPEVAWPDLAPVKPDFSWQGLLGLGIPLFAITLMAQNLPGALTLQAAGYRPATSRLLSRIGLSNLLLAPFGGYALNLSTLTAAICTDVQAHPDPQRRYTAAVWAGLFYLLAGLGAPWLCSLLLAMPAGLLSVMAGLALLGSLGNALALALREETQREVGLITALVCTSGLTLAGLGPAFWALLAGLLSHTLLTARRAPQPSALETR